MSENHNDQNQITSADADEGTTDEIEQTTDKVVEEHIVETTLDEAAALQVELDKTRAQADEYLDGWQRARAEFANYKKRVGREQTYAYQNAAGSIIKRYLDVADDLARALKDRPQEGEGAAWANGIELIYRKVLDILEKEGVSPMEAEGQPFDPTLHEAITSEESDQYESGQIIEVIQPGYMLGERVLRPAMVRVAR